MRSNTSGHGCTTLGVNAEKKALYLGGWDDTMTPVEATKASIASAVQKLKELSRSIRPEDRNWQCDALDRLNDNVVPAVNALEDQLRDMHTLFTDDSVWNGYKTEDLSTSGGRQRSVQGKYHNDAPSVVPENPPCPAVSPQYNNDSRHSTEVNQGNQDDECSRDTRQTGESRRVTVCDPLTSPPGLGDNFETQTNTSIPPQPSFPPPYALPNDYYEPSREDPRRQSSMSNGSFSRGTIPVALPISEATDDTIRMKKKKKGKKDKTRGSLLDDSPVWNGDSWIEIDAPAPVPQMYPSSIPISLPDGSKYMLLKVPETFSSHLTQIPSTQAQPE